MSTSDLALAPGAHPPDALRARPAALGGRLFRSELRLVFGRRRNQVMLGVLALAPVILGIAIRLGSSGGRGAPALLDRIAGNGLFLSFTSLAVALPVFLPLAVSVVSGESIAGESASGTLRNLLVVPVGRTRLLLVKFAAMVVYALACTALVALVGVVVGLLLFPSGPVTLLSGDVIGQVDALVRVALVALYVAAMLTTVAAIGLFVSTLTEVPIAAMATTAIVVVLITILQAVPQISAIHPYLFSDSWLAFGDLLRDPVSGDAMARGLGVQAIYVAVFCSLAWARFGSRDVTS